MFLFSKTFPIVYFVFPLYLWMTSYLWIRLEWFPNILFLNKKLRIENKKLLVQNHTWFYSKSEITNQAHSTPSFNFLATIRRRLGTEIQKPKKNRNQRINNAKYILCNANQNKDKKVFLFHFYYLCYAQRILWTHFLCYDELKTQDQEQVSNRVNSHLILFTKWDHKSRTPNTFIQCIGDRKTTIGCVNSEAEDKSKLANYKCTRSPL